MSVLEFIYDVLGVAPSGELEFVFYIVGAAVVLILLDGILSLLIGSITSIFKR